MSVSPTLYKISDKNGNLNVLKSYPGMRKTWDIIVPGHYLSGGDGNTGFFFYDGGKGIGAFYNTDAQGNFTAWGGDQSVNKTWDMIIPVKLGTPHALTNLLFYSKKNGNAAIYRPDANGKLTKLKDHSFSPRWDIIVSGKFMGYSNDDLLFYDRESGEAKFFSVNHFGDLELRSNPFWRKTWHTIISGNFADTPTGNSSLFFYDNVRGEGKFFRSEETKLVLLGKFDMQKDWDIIVARDVYANNSLSGLLFYNRKTGICKVYSISTTSNFNLEFLKEHTLQKMRNAIIPLTRPHQLNNFLVYGYVNQAIYLDWGSYIDTEVEFSHFFDNDHTIMCWFMPQYPNGYEGPIIAENGSGTFLIYQGYYYTDSNTWVDTIPEPDQRHQGDYPLCVKIGNTKRGYLIPEWQNDSWLHIALVRKNNVFSLYINGKHKYPVILTRNTNAPPTQTPDTEINAAGMTDKPSGKLRFGRRTTSANDDNRNWQAYGLLDEVAVFDRALDENQITDIMTQKRLTGNLTGIIAGWSFDNFLKPDSPDYNKPPNSNWQPSVKVVNSLPHITTRTTIVTLGKQHSKDSRAFVDPNLIAKNQSDLYLPFKYSEIWNVNQGYDNGEWSHSAVSNFSYDLGRDPNPSNADVLAGSTGLLIEYLINAGVPADSINEQNIIRIMQSPNEIISYRHIADNSTPPVISGGTVDASSGRNFIDDSVAPTIKEGFKIGEVGTSAKHLHIALWSTRGGTAGRGLPVAFKQYEFSENKGKSWQFVSRGHPKQGQWIRRFSSIPQGVDGP